MLEINLFSDLHKFLNFYNKFILTIRTNKKRYCIGSACLIFKIGSTENVIGFRLLRYMHRKTIDLIRSIISCFSLEGGSLPNPNSKFVSNVELYQFVSANNSIFVVLINYIVNIRIVRLDILSSLC